MIAWALVACVPRDRSIPLVPTDTGTADSGTVTDTAGGSGDTGGSGTCPLEVTGLAGYLCVETTGPGREPDSGAYDYGLHQISGSGLVTEVGGLLELVPGSTPYAELRACGPEHVHQVRLVDDDGETWTFGWDIGGPLDDVSTASIVPGSDLDFTVVQDAGWEGFAVLLISDAVGPLFLLESSNLLTPDQRGGITVDIDREDACVEGDPESGTEHYLVSFTWDGGVVALRSGGSALVPLPEREVEVVVGASSYNLGCLDTCSADWWAAWAEEP